DDTQQLTTPVSRALRLEQDRQANGAQEGHGAQLDHDDAWAEIELSANSGHEAVCGGEVDLPACGNYYSSRKPMADDLQKWVGFDGGSVVPFVKAHRCIASWDTPSLQHSPHRCRICAREVYFGPQLRASVRRAPSRLVTPRPRADRYQARSGCAVPGGWVERRPAARWHVLPRRCRQAPADAVLAHSVGVIRVNCG